MEQAGLNQLMWELHASLRACGIPVSPKIDPQVGINRRAKRRLGCCFYREGRCFLEVSESILENEALLRTTLVHELLHT